MSESIVIFVRRPNKGTHFYSWRMAVPQDVEAPYGAAPQVVAARSVRRTARIALVSLTVGLTMVVAIAFLASDNKSEPISDLVLTPDAKLNNLVTSLAEHGDTMSLQQMEAVLDSWRTDPNTMLDMAEKDRTQVT